MNNVPFEQTVMGHRFFEGQLPSLIESLRELVKEVNALRTELAETNKQVAELKQFEASCAEAFIPGFGDGAVERKIDRNSWQVFAKVPDGFIYAIDSAEPFDDDGDDYVGSICYWSYDSTGKALDGGYYAVKELDENGKWNIMDHIHEIVECDPAEVTQLWCIDIADPDNLLSEENEFDRSWIQENDDSEEEE